MSKSTGIKIDPNIPDLLKKNLQKKTRTGNPKWTKGMKAPNPKGRTKGAKNRNTVIAKAYEAAAATGILPLQYMLNVMRDPAEETDIRLQAAQAAAPYLHRKMPIGIEHTPGRYGSLTAEQIRALPTPALEELLQASNNFYTQLVRIGVAKPAGEIIDVIPT